MLQLRIAQARLNDALSLLGRNMSEELQARLSQRQRQLDDLKTEKRGLKTEKPEDLDHATAEKGTSPLPKNECKELRGASDDAVLVKTATVNSGSLIDQSQNKPNNDQGLGGCSSGDDVGWQIKLGKQVRK
ncbi:hypothetical protein MRX96_057337 [Rhipicephalus microplus]